VQLGKTAEVVEEGDQQMKWASWLYGLMQSAPVLTHAPGDGSAYVAAGGGTFASKAWLTMKAIQDGVIGDDAAEAFAAWLPEANKNRRDAGGRQHKLLALPDKSPLLVEGFVVPDEKNEVAGSTEAKTAEIQCRNSATGDLDAG
jgi:hypothetical protein